MMLFDVFARRFKQFAILHAAGTGNFARETTKAEINVAHDRVIKRHASVLHGAHQVNTSAW